MGHENIKELESTRSGRWRRLQFRLAEIGLGPYLLFVES